MPLADYGIDAPGVRRGLFALGCGAAASSIVLAAFALKGSGVLSPALKAGSALSALGAFYGLGMAAYMTRWSRVGKLRSRDRLLDRAEALSPWTGRETVLDVGCGRGLMMVGAARRLNGGTAVGIDVWRTEDQSDNTPDAALENAKREGVSDRVRVETGDARTLPFADASFDVVASHWVVHNLPEAADRFRALDEMLRVLRPGGVLILADIAHHREYRAHLRAHGLTKLHVDDEDGKRESSAS